MNTDSENENLSDDKYDDKYDFYIEEPYNALNSEELSDTKQNTKKRSVFKGILFDLVFYALIVFVCIYVLPNYVIQRTIVDGTSMENTLHNNEQLFVEKISYRLNNLDRFDIIVFYPYGRKNKDYYVKRIIGLPGETVQIKENKIYVNNKILKEHYGKETIEDPGRAAKPIKLKNDEYFVLGDNRNISKDSRYPSVGNVNRVNIGGKVILRIRPFSRFGTVD